MLHNVCTIERTIEIGCHGCSVAMVTSENPQVFNNFPDFSIMSSTICIATVAVLAFRRVRDVRQTSANSQSGLSRLH